MKTAGIKAAVPRVLIYTRGVLAAVIIVLSLLHVNHYEAWAVALLITGLLTDVFDGIIARRLGVSNQGLRRLDSITDQVFFSAFAVATYIHCPAFFRSNALLLIVLCATEAATYIVSFLKFRKEIATHSIGAKLWTLLLTATLVQVTLQCSAPVLFLLCFWVGMLTRLEIIAIILLLKTWTNDVPTVRHALALRRGRDIHRSKWFNG